MALKIHSTFSDNQKLILQIERDLLAQTHLKAMLVAAAATLKAHRKELRDTKARASHKGRDARGKRPKR